MIRHGSTSDTSHTTPVVTEQRVLRTLCVVASSKSILCLSSNGCVSILVATVLTLIWSIEALLLQVSLEVLVSHSLSTPLIVAGNVHIATPIVRV